MHCPVGYTTLVEMFDQIRGNPSAKIAFGNAVAKLTPILAACDDGKIVRLNPGTTYRADSEDPLSFVLIDTMTWCVSLQKVRDASQDFGQNLKVGFAILVANFETPDGMIEWPVNEGCAVQPSLAESLETFEGCTLVMADALAEEWFNEVVKKTLVAPVQKAPKHVSTESLEEAFQTWADSFQFPAKPNQAERKAWWKSNGITRDRYRQLEKKFKPSYWSKSGANRK